MQRRITGDGDRHRHRDRNEQCGSNTRALNHSAHDFDLDDHHANRGNHTADSGRGTDRR